MYPAASRLLVAAVILCFSQFLSAAQQASERYTLFVALQPPYEGNRATLQKMLKGEGYESFAEGDREIVVVLSAAQLEKLFQARVRMRILEKSATRGTASQPTLESARIPARFGKLIDRLYFDPQRS